jgi:hypothetical protein
MAGSQKLNKKQKETQASHKRPDERNFHGCDLFTTHHSCFLGVNLMSREGNSRPLGPILITVGPSGYHDILTAEVVIDVEFLGS